MLCDSGVKTAARRYAVGCAETGHPVGARWQRLARSTVNDRGRGEVIPGP